MKIRHTLLASLAVVVMGANMAFGQLDIFWQGGDGNWDDNNWADSGGIPVEPGFGDNIFIPSGTVTLNSDQTGTIGDFGGLRIGDGTLIVTTGGKVSFDGGNTILLGTPENSSATLIMEGNAVFSSGSFLYGSDAGSTGNVIIRDTASFNTKNAQDIIGHAVAFGAGTWTTVGSGVTIHSDDDIWVGPDDVWIANITDADTFSTAIADDAFGFVENAAVQVNLSGFTQEVGQRWRLIESHGETTQGPIANAPLPATFTVTGLEPGFGMTIMGEEVNDTLGFLDVEMVNVLNLRVDTTTGNVFLENPAPGALPLDIDAYTITSESGSLVDSAFNGLAGNGEANWVPGLAPSQGPNRISEANFDGSTVIGAANAPTGDGDGDGDVDGADFLLWQRNFGDDPADDPPGSPGNGDYNNDGKVDDADFGVWANNFGAMGGGGGFALGAIFNTSGTQDLAMEFHVAGGETLTGTVEYFASGLSASAVPEPSSFALAGLWLIAIVAWRRRR